MAEPAATVAVAPSVDDARRNRERLGAAVITTPIRELVDDALRAALAPGTRVWLKEELFQRTGSFKPRGALTVMQELDAASLARGVTGISAGNHAISLAYCAARLGTTAHVVMPRTADPYRVRRCRELGAEVELAEDIHAALARVGELEAAGRTFVHPYEGPLTALGTATVGVELVDQLRAAGVEPDAVVVAVGGGGLAAGVGSALHGLAPATAVYGVEPTGADSLRRSLDAGAPRGIDRVATIADSLGAPRCEPYSFALNRRFLADVVLVDDDQIREAMRLLLTAAKLAVEPAGAAALAALLHPLRDRLAGACVCVIVCGANTAPETFARHVGAGA